MPLRGMEYKIIVPQAPIVQFGLGLRRSHEVTKQALDEGVWQFLLEFCPSYEIAFYCV